MIRETKKQRQERFVEDFLRRLHEAPEGARVYIPVGNLFNPAEVHSIDELRAARRMDRQKDGGH